MALLNPVKTTNYMSDFIADLDSAFGEHIYRPSGINADVHYVDEEHSLGFSAASMNVYIGDKSMFSKSDGNAYGKYYVIGKDRNSLYFEWYSGASLHLTVVAAKASSGKWNVFILENTAEKPKLYYNTPNTDFVICDPSLKISEANTPYIISPYPDLSGGVMSGLFRVDYLSAFDKNNPPVLAVGDGLYAVPPYPLHTSDTAAFAIPIDPVDYEQEV